MWNDKSFEMVVRWNPCWIKYVSVIIVVNYCDCCDIIHTAKTPTPWVLWLLTVVSTVIPASYHIIVYSNVNWDHVDGGSKRLTKTHVNYFEWFATGKPMLEIIPEGKSFPAL